MKGYPETLEEFEEYFDDFVENKLVRHPVAVELIEQMRAAPPVPKTVPKALRPAVKKVAATASVPFQDFNYLTTVGVMDPRVREILGLTWTNEEQRHLEKIHRRLRFAYRTLPERAIYFPPRLPRPSPQRRHPGHEEARKAERCLQVRSQVIWAGPTRGRGGASVRSPR